jgi:hypothetical protein
MSVGLGITVTFGSAAISKVIDVSVSGQNCPTVDASHQGLTVNSNNVAFRLHESSKLVEPGELSVKCLFDGTLPAIGSQGTLAVYWGPQIAKTWTWSADTNDANSAPTYTGYDPSGNLGAEQMVTLKFKLSGPPVVA